MAHELTGLEFLKKNEIKNMKYDAGKPFAFISYSHDKHDSQIVMNIFKKMYKMGYNLWIDVANIPHDENAWTDAAEEALDNENCKCAIFFRSENSMIKDTIIAEIENICELKHISCIVVIDIWENEKIESAQNARKIIVNNPGNDPKTREAKRNCRRLCRMVSVDSNAVRLEHDAENDINKAVNEIINLDEIKNNVYKKDTINDNPPVQLESPIVGPKHDPEVIITGPKPLGDGHDKPAPTPPKPEPTNNKYYYIKVKNSNAVICYKNAKYILLKGSIINNTIEDNLNKKVHAYFNNNSIYQNGRRFITEDIVEELPSALAQLIYGTSVSGNVIINKASTIQQEEAEKILNENAKAAGQMYAAVPTPVYNDSDKNIDVEEDNDTTNSMSKGKSKVIYKFTIYDKKYENCSLKYMMTTVFEEVLRHNPDKLEAALEKCYSSLRKGDIIGKVGEIIDGKQVSSRFSSGKVININGTTVSIGSSASAEAVKGLFRALFDACGEEYSVFKGEDNK